MSSPVATIADALIAFILSLLRDPEAADEFVANPRGSMASGGVQDACLADVRAVTPVVVDHASVTPRPPRPDPPEPPGPPDPVVNEIIRLVQQFTTIDNRSTILDQSVNQNIWTEGGDVTQVFDQEAVVASGDDAVAAGDDATVNDNDTDLTVGDVAIGNEDYNNSFNDNDDASDNSSVADSFQDNSIEVGESNIASPVSSNDGGASQNAPVSEAVVEEPADVLDSDMTAPSSEGYTDDSTGAVATDMPMVEEPAEEL